MKPNARLVALLVIFAPIVGLSACGPKLDPVIESTGGDAGTGTGGTGTTTSTDPGTTGGTTGGTSTTSGVCGTTSATISYAGQAGTVIKTSCGSSNCHGGTQRPVMTDFASAKTGISGGGLAEVMSGGMPLGGSLSTNDKCIITTWASGSYAP